MGGAAVPPTFTMRDNRDPSAIGEVLLERQGWGSPEEVPLHVVADTLPRVWIANYGETEDEFETRIAAEYNKRGNTN